MVICAYNAAATLDECLRHTGALDYPDLEILVIDDGSTDDTVAIARSHPRVRLESIAHGGLSVARNHGFAVARGDSLADAITLASRAGAAVITGRGPYSTQLALDE